MSPENHNFWLLWPLFSRGWCDSVWNVGSQPAECWQLAPRPGARPCLSPGSRERKYCGKIVINEKSVDFEQSVQNLTINHHDAWHTWYFPSLPPWHHAPTPPWSSWHRTLVHCSRVRNDPGFSHHRTAARGRSQHPAEYSVIKQKRDKVKMTEEYLLAWNDHHATFFSAMSDLVAGIKRKGFQFPFLMNFFYEFS